MSASVTNMEEAASVAAEYVASLDNLPTEIQFLLAEIKHKETRSQELAQDIQKETSKYIRHALRNSGSSNGASSAPSKDTSAAALAKDAAIPAKVAEQHSQIDMLAQEKIVLAQRVVTLLTRARSRLDHDLARVLVLQGDLAPNMLNSYASASAGSIRGPAGAITDSLRHALAGGAPVGIGEPVALVSARLSSPVPPANKKRKVASGASVKLSSPAPSGVVGAAVLGGSSAAIGSGRGRGSAASAAAPGGSAGARSVPAAPRGRRAVVQQVVEELSEDGVEEEADALEGEGEDAEDNNTYCFCQRKSFGEMVGCDNPDCPYQWFHLECVNLTTPLPDQWYCSECTAKGHAEKPRKGRKK